MLSFLRCCDESPQSLLNTFPNHGIGGFVQGFTEWAAKGASMDAIFLPIRWAPRLDPLLPIAVAAQGDAASVLARRLLREWDREPPTGLSGVAAADILILLGEAEGLPWIDGVQYLGRDPTAPSLLLPTVLSPTVAPSLLERALLRRFRDLVPPLAILLSGSRVASVAAVRPLDRDRLRAWLEKGPA